MKLRAAVCLLLLTGCDKEESPKAAPDSGAADKGASKDGDKADAADEAGEKAEDEGKADAPKGAAGDAPEAVPTDSNCPKSLSGKETVDRVITKACGVVPVTGNYSIDGGSLTLEAGATLAFKDGTSLAVGYYEPGKLIVNGTEAEPVTFTSSGDKAPGVWKGVRLHEKAARSSITGLVLEYAGDRNGALKVDAEDVTVRSSKFQHLKEVGVTAGRDASFADFSDNSITDVGKVAMRLPAQVVSGLGTGNTFSDSAKIVVTNGTIEAEAEWLAQGTALLIDAEVKVNGKDGTSAKLRLDPGLQLEFSPNARLSVGYYSGATLEAEGTADKPILFTSSEKKEAAAWRGLAIYGKGQASLDHVKFEYGGKRDTEGVLFVDGTADVSIDHASFENNAVGAVFRGREVVLGGVKNSSFSGTPVAVRIDPAVMSGLGEGNTYAGDARIEIARGTVAKDATWAVQPGARVVIAGDLQISKAHLKIPAGSVFHVADGASITVGYYDVGGLSLMGTAEKPVRFVGEREAAGAWKSIVLHDKAKGNVLQHVELMHAGGKAGLEVRKGAEGKVDGLSCESCGAGAVLTADGTAFETANVK